MLVTILPAVFLALALPRWIRKSFAANLSVGVVGVAFGLHDIFFTIRFEKLG